MRERLVALFAEALDDVTTASAEEYQLVSPLMLDYVDRKLTAELESSSPGSGLPDIAIADRRAHVDLMSFQLRIKSAPTLLEVVVWIYLEYAGRGFDPDYVNREFRVWREAVEHYISPANAAPIVRIYDLMLESQLDFLALSKKRKPETPVAAEFREPYERYLAAILKPSAVDALRCSRDHIAKVEDIKPFWLNVIRPAMHEVGRLWDNGEITPGQEHLASSITQRVMASYYPLILETEEGKGRLVLAASPGEVHEIGPRMVADLLEIEGWNVFYTGANTPADSVVDLLKRESVACLCISTTLAINLPEAQSLISRVKKAIHPKPIHILTGGQAYEPDKDLWRKIGADAFTNDVDSAIEMLENWHCGQ